MMQLSKLLPLLATYAEARAELQPLFEPHQQKILHLVLDFLATPVHPQGTATFEKDLEVAVRALGRTLVEFAVNHLESDQPEATPERIQYQGQEYRRRPKSPNRHVATLFGNITLWRYLYEPLTPGERSFFPLELNLGLEAGIATPALASFVGRGATEETQQVLLGWLREHHGVSWSVATLRKVVASLRDGLEVHRQPAQVQRLLQWLQEAAATQGCRRVVLAVGRDGIMLPLRKAHGPPEFHEGATATVTVYDRQQRRLGTVYLGRMPEPGQGTLTAQLTALLQAVLASWTGPPLRLVYITDAGYHPQEYYRQVLRRMTDPRHPRRRLVWQWIVDFWHASGYVVQLAEALWGPGRAAAAWARKLSHWLKHQPNGVYRVLHAAAAVHYRRVLSAREEEAYQEAYRYLRKYRAHMDYAGYRQQGVPIGSGVTEAACKTVFTQRLKRAGMSWQEEGGQVVVDLRVLALSGVWEEVEKRYLQAKPTVNLRTHAVPHRRRGQKAA